VGLSLEAKVNGMDLDFYVVRFHFVAYISSFTSPIFLYTNPKNIYWLFCLSLLINYNKIPFVYFSKKSSKHNKGRCMEEQGVVIINATVILMQIYDFNKLCKLMQATVGKIFKC
jgi:hypothetical protein